MCVEKFEENVPVTYGITSEFQDNFYFNFPKGMYEIYNTSKV